MCEHEEEKHIYKGKKKFVGNSWLKQQQQQNAVFLCMCFEYYHFDIYQSKEQITFEFSYHWQHYSVSIAIYSPK